MDCISKAALYVRVSTEEQANEGQSISAQLETLKQYCKLYCIEIYDIYEDPGLSGKDTLNRPGLQRLLADAKCNCFNMVLVWKLSRLSRNLKDLLGIIDLFEKKDIVFSSYSEKFDTSTPVGRMTLQLLGSIAEFERNTIIDNVKLGLQEYARKGGKTGTVFGYDSSGRQLVINPSEAAIVRLIYHLYVQELWSLTEITNHLNQMGCLTKRGKPFRKDAVSVILENPVYIGQNRHQLGTGNEYCTAGSHLPIIEQELWQAVQKLRSKNRSSRHRTPDKTDYPLSGKLLCPNCSKRLQGSSSFSKGKNYRYYRCKSCKYSCRAEALESAVKAMLDGLEPALKTEARINQSYIQQQEREFYVKEFNKTMQLMDKYILLHDQHNQAGNTIVSLKIKQLTEKLQTLQRCIKDLEQETPNTLAEGKILLNSRLDSVELLPDGSIRRLNFV